MFSKLRGSVFGDKTKTLNEFAYEIGTKHRRELFANGRDPGGLARLAIFVSPSEQSRFECISHPLIQRRFAYEHSTLLAQEEFEEPAPQSDSDSQTQRPTKKRKPKRGRTAADEHFWAQMDKWFEEKNAEWGQFTSEPWKQYVESFLLPTCG